MYSEKLVSALIKFVVVVLLIKFAFFSGFFNSSVYKGDAYSIVPPPGWERVQEKKSLKVMLESFEKPDVVTFVAPEKDIKTGMPEASLSVLVVKLAQPTWMEDEFPSLVQSLADSGYRIIDRGQIMIDQQVFYWVFYHDLQNALLNMEFYMTNDLNKLYKIQFTTAEEAFKRHRPAFEAAKDTIKLSQQLW